MSYWDIYIYTYMCTDGCVMEYMGYHIMEIVFFSAYGYIMEISYKFSYN